MYLRRLIDSYLCDRSVECPVRDGSIRFYPMTAGVLQGSVLGSFLWNVAYNYVIELRPRLSCEFFAYADDTLVVAAGPSLDVVRSRINSYLCCGD